MRRGTLDVIYALALAGLGGFLLRETLDPRYADTMGLGMASDPAFYPRILLTGWLGLAGILLVRGLLSPGDAIPAPRGGRLVATIAIVAAYTAAISLIGFLFSSVLLSIVLMVMLGFRRPVLVAVIGTAFPLVIWYTFVSLLRIPLPASPWFRAF